MDKFKKVWDCKEIETILKFFPNGIVYKISELKEWQK